MPTYEYECLKCGHQFEKFQNMTEEPVKRCPECRCKVRRLLGTGAGIIFKGSGFYETDYRSEKYSSEAKKERESAEKSDKKTDTDKKTGQEKADAAKKTSAVKEKSTADAK